MQPISVAAVYAETISSVTGAQSPLQHDMSSSTKLKLGHTVIGQGARFL